MLKEILVDIKQEIETLTEIVGMLLDIPDLSRQSDTFDDQV